MVDDCIFSFSEAWGGLQRVPQAHQTLRRANPARDKFLKAPFVPSSDAIQTAASLPLPLPRLK